MKNETIRKLVLSAMFAALCCVATMIVQIPTVAGYTNLGECMCLLAGYGAYVPATFVIKGLVALIAALLLRLVRKEGMPAVW